jgi:predicted dehydrogenase
MSKVRLGIIGLGNIGQHHFGYLTAGKVSRAEVVAVSDAVPAKLEKYKPLKTFTDGEELLRSGLVDAVIIATPHYQHTTLGIAALNQGLHVMVEKPISAHKADAERLIAAHRQHPKLVFAGMFQLRAEPRYLKIRKLIQNGDLGHIVRMSWITPAGAGARPGGARAAASCLTNASTISTLCNGCWGCPRACAASAN